ncbi:MAG TPA: T9SS type A sorting domain-containing protein [Panacibacter sp.]|nr:T9SS type A sorting domain-containing protein [Panacibacter sp.]
MKKTLYITLLLLLHFSGKTQDIKIYFQTPYWYNVLYKNDVFIQVAVESTNSVSDVHASIEGLDTSLIYNSYNHYYEGRLSLSGLPDGDTVSFKVTVTDVLNNQKSDSIKVIYDILPVLIIDSPLAESVARPTIKVKVRSIDNDSCRLWVSFGRDYETLIYDGKIKDSAELTFDLTGRETYAGYGHFEIELIDKRYRGVIKRTGDIYIEGSPVLSDYYAANTKIMDFNFNKVFVLGDSVPQPAIIDIATGDTTIIPFDGTLDGIYHNVDIITPFGAMFNDYYGSGYDFNKGKLYNLGSYISSAFKVSGDYATYVNEEHGSTLHLRDLSAHFDTVLYEYGDQSGDVAQNGVVAYSADIFPNIYAYQNGNTIKLTNNHNDFNLYGYPITDGNFIAYQKYLECCGYSIVLYDSKSFIEINTNNAYPFTSWVETQSRSLNNKFLAYLKADSLNKNQIWLRDSLGNNFQQTFSNGNLGIEILNQYGDVMYKSREGRFLTLRSGETFKIGTTLGKPYYRDSTWYISIGRMLYTVIPSHILPLKLISFTIVKKQDNTNLLQWSTEEENNSSNISVERSTDGRNFSVIAKVTAANKPSVNSYSFTDAQPLHAVNYYRLKIIDKDGRFQYSTIKKIDNTIKLSAAVFPNPAKNSFYLKIENEKMFEGIFEIISMKGEIIQSQKIIAAAGNSSRIINIASLAKGSYYIRLISLTDHLTLKFEKL